MYFVITYNDLNIKMFYFIYFHKGLYFEYKGTYVSTGITDIVLSFPIFSESISNIKCMHI